MKAPLTPKTGRANLIRNSCLALSLEAARAALEDEDYLRATRLRILISRARLAKSLTATGFEVTTTDALPSGGERDVLFAADVGVSGIDYLIAETGSLAILAKPEEPQRTVDRDVTRLVGQHADAWCSEQAVRLHVPAGVTQHARACRRFS